MNKFLYILDDVCLKKKSHCSVQHGSAAAAGKMEKFVKPGKRTHTEWLIISIFYVWKPREVCFMLNILRLLKAVVIQTWYMIAYANSSRKNSSRHLSKMEANSKDEGRERRMESEGAWQRQSSTMSFLAARVGGGKKDLCCSTEKYDWKWCAAG